MNVQNLLFFQFTIYTKSNTQVKKATSYQYVINIYIIT